MNTYKYIIYLCGQYIFCSSCKYIICLHIELHILSISVKTTSGNLNQIFLEQLLFMIEQLQQNKQCHCWKECQATFELSKQQLMSSRSLAYYDPALPICLATDASQYGVRVVISHIMPNDLEKPVAFELWTLAKELGTDGEVLPYMFGFVVIKLLNVTSMYPLAIMRKSIVLRL